MPDETKHPTYSSYAENLGNMAVVSLLKEIDTGINWIICLLALINIAVWLNVWF